MSIANVARKVAIVGNQAFSMINFRGPLIAELVARGHQVFALAPDYDKNEELAISGLGAIPVHFSLDRNGMNPIRDVADVLKLARLLRCLQVDVVLSYFIKPVVYGSLAAKLAGVPRRVALIEGAGSTLSDNPIGLKGRSVRCTVIWLCRLALRQTHKTIFLNDDDIDLFISQRMVQRNQVCKIDGIGIDLDKYDVRPAATTPIQFLMMARLIYDKGVCEFVEAARRLKRKKPDVRFVLLGGIDSNPNAISETTIRQWVKEGVIEWPGQVNDVRHWLEKTSVFVLPSYYREGLPRSTLEAMAMGRPVITTDWVGCRETVLHGENGFLVPIKDPEVLADAMLRFVENPSLIHTMGTKSRRIAEQRFDVRQINKLILDAMDIEP